MNIIPHEIPDMAEREHIVARLRNLSHIQQLREQGMSSYEEWYRVEPKVGPLPMLLVFRFDSKRSTFNQVPQHVCQHISRRRLS
jgi:hypothetical protein